MASFLNYRDASRDPRVIEGGVALPVLNNEVFIVNEEPATESFTVVSDPIDEPVFITEGRESDALLFCLFTLPLRLLRLYFRSSFLRFLDIIFNCSYCFPFLFSSAFDLSIFLLFWIFSWYQLSWCCYFLLILYHDVYIFSFTCKSQIHYIPLIYSSNSFLFTYDIYRSIL